MMGRAGDEATEPHAALWQPTWPFPEWPGDGGEGAAARGAPYSELEGPAGEEGAEGGAAGDGAGEEGEEALLPALYVAKTRTWGSWVLSQWAAARRCRLTSG